MSKIEQLLVEKYRPKALDEYVFNSENVKYRIEKWIKKGSIPHLLMSGSPGTGKTTLARVIVNELGLDKSDVKEINASLLGVGQITEELIPWMRKASFGNFRVIILDEADRISKQGQEVLRKTIEDYSDSVRFIATCNFPNKIIPPLHSRFQLIEMDSMDRDGVIDFIADILMDEELGFEEEEDLFSHIDAYAPDIRKILNSIDEHTKDGIIMPLESLSASKDVDEWSQLWASEFFELEDALALTELVDQENFESFYQTMYENHKRFANPERAIILLSTYLDRAQVSANQPLHLTAFLYHAFKMDGSDE